MTERQKIDALLAAIRKSKLTFIRNGEEHTADEAASHLEDKLAHAGADISARDFIENVASRSSLSGEPYLVRINGTEMKAHDWWLERLKEIEHP